MVFYPSVQVFEQLIIRTAKVLERNLRAMEQKAFQLNASRSRGGGGCTENDKATTRVEEAFGGKKQVSEWQVCVSVGLHVMLPHLTHVRLQHEKNKTSSLVAHSCFRFWQTMLSFHAILPPWTIGVQKVMSKAMP